MHNLHELQAIYTSLVSSSAFKSIVDFIEARGSTHEELDYNSMRTKINLWFASGAIQSSIGLPSTDSLPLGMRLLVADSTGTRVYDTPAGSNNQYANIDVLVAGDPKGKRLIGHSIGTWPYVHAAVLSAAGTSFNSRYSDKAGAKILSFTVRIGTLTEPVGTVILSMNA